MATPATSSDLQARSFRTLSADELTVGGVLLDDAWTLVLSAKPSAADRITTDTVFLALVKQTLCAMVLRVLSNPEGKLEERQDDYQYRLDSAVSSGALYLSEAELARLSEGDGVSDGAFTIRPAYGAQVTEAPGVWVPL